ncbi:hypothetical protein [Rhodopseudomonas pseudopalustris]|nr:hypothetical protein [Rhodopseudomonas pseudopalustris]ABE39026.1 hypothetical protein RPD_1790 [Rhodopseudomonas palustris BisB5]MBB1091145.1 hypothetical protein [Rhodopseudomonas palustris]
MSIEWLWGIGLLVLPAAMAYAVMRNRNRTAAEKQRTDTATKEVYRAQEREDTGQPLPGDRT